jgi:hypothetical protein
LSLLALFFRSHHSETNLASLLIFGTIGTVYLIVSIVFLVAASATILNMKFSRNPKPRNPGLIGD